jgi:hypothetical protein
MNSSPSLRPAMILYYPCACIVLPIMSLVRSKERKGDWGLHADLFGTNSELHRCEVSFRVAESGRKIRQTCPFEYERVYARVLLLDLDVGSAVPA